MTDAAAGLGPIAHIGRSDRWLAVLVAPDRTWTTPPGTERQEPPA